VRSPEYAEFRQPSHINCRRRLIYIRKDEEARADFERPPDDLIRKHGHYHVQPARHAELRIPASGSGRHIIVRRVRNLETGELGTRLDWAPHWERIPQWKRDLVLKARAETDDLAVVAILEKLGINDLDDAGQLRELTLLGIRDRVDGWLTVPKGAALTAPLPRGRRLLRGKGKPHSALFGLRNEDHRRPWTEADYRREALEDLYLKVTGPDPAAAAAATKRIDDAVVAGMKALGIDRFKPRSVAVEHLDLVAGQKSPDCDLRISTDQLHRAISRKLPDEVWRTWVHESVHARDRWAPGYSSELVPFNGYEDGLAEVVARLVTAGRARMTVLAGSYDYYAAAYRTLARAAGWGKRIWRGDSCAFRLAR
jgi:hypothetical protein